MTIRNIDKFFNPKRIAVMGTNEQRDKVGYTLLRELDCHGYNGVGQLP